MSCPEAVPSRKKGESSASDTLIEISAAIPHSRVRCSEELVCSGRGESLIWCSSDCNRKQNLALTFDHRSIQFFVFVNHAFFHHEEDVFRLANVLYRIAGHGHHIGKFANFERARFVCQSQQIRVA